MTSSSDGGDMKALTLQVQKLITQMGRFDVELKKQQARMDTLEEDFRSMQHTLKQINERSLRGERLLVEIQGEQRLTDNIVRSIAQALAIPVSPTIFPPQADDGNDPSSHS